MMTIIKTDHYTTLVQDIAALYNQARHALVESYWQIGRRIVEQEQRGDGQAGYGAGLLEQLSEDLSTQFGSGFSVRNLRNMRRFYNDNRNRQPAADLSWSQHVELLPITNKADKQRLARQIVSEKLSRRQIRQAVHRIEKDKESPGQDETPVLLPEPCRDRPLQRYGLIDPARVTCARGSAVVDCGFNIWREIPKQEAALHACPQGGDPSYTYPAKVESVIDGDTVWVIVDCGGRIMTRQKLRLHLIDAYEKGTPEGDRATRFVRRVLKKSPDIVVCTHHYDKYTRYLADVFYLPDASNPKTVYTRGLYLNQQLVDKGLAQPWKV
jgi:endonuclease YncB( thermonuclease family)